MSQKIRTAIYARISTQEGRQHLENQISACQGFIHGRAEGYDAPRGDFTRWIAPAPERIYTDTDSGAKPNRPGLARLLKDAAAGRFDALVVFDLSRLTREGPARAFTYIQTLTSHQVEFYSVNEAHFRTGGIQGDLLIAIAAYFYSEERRAIQQRVRAGIQRARQKGKRLGRPAASVDPATLSRLKREGLSTAAIARALKCSTSTIERRIRWEKSNARPLEE